jgi:hypothetical protein
MPTTSSPTTAAPSGVPTTPQPSPMPTAVPTAAPSFVPSSRPSTALPTSNPSAMPTASPTTPAPVVNAAVPMVAPITGHTSIQLQGEWLGLNRDDVLSVSLGGILCLDVIFESPLSVVCVTLTLEQTVPMGPIVVATRHGGRGTDSTNGFQFVCPIRSFEIPATSGAAARGQRAGAHGPQLIAHMHRSHSMHSLHL